MTGHDAAHDQVDQVRKALAIVEEVAADRGLLADLTSDELKRLMRAIEKIAFPDRAARKALLRTLRRRERVDDGDHKRADEDLLAQTGIRARAGSRQFKRSHPPAPELDAEERGEPRQLNTERTCYICKQSYRELHFFYDLLCPECSELNWSRRHQTVDLSGRHALVTGGRVKIGYQVALKLLRAGAHVVVTTRFPHDATQRFVMEDDHTAWIDKLQVHGIDLRHTPSVEALCDHLCTTLPRLDFVLNNACQTVRRPPGFYAHLMDGERKDASLSDVNRTLLASHDSLLARQAAAGDAPTNLPAQVDASLAGIRRAAELSQIPLAQGDRDGGERLFPDGELDGDLQQIDMRTVNSWRLRLAEVPTVELLEVHLVNAVAPFVLNARLKPLMLRVPSRDKHIVNVSAMEGVFYRAYKTDKHPHTNMAKAALNMLTRTSAQDYARDGIHMNSVDTGWITDEDPVEIAERKSRELGFNPPLDVVDAAARICDPIFTGFLTGEHPWGQFFKDYKVANW